MIYENNALNIYVVVFDTRMLRSNICESLWLLECGVSVGQLNNGK
jgi:hypothetical protein